MYNISLKLVTPESKEVIWHSQGERGVCHKGTDNELKRLPPAKDGTIRTSKSITIAIN
jgi:hypothetical protein